MSYIYIYIYTYITHKEVQPDQFFKKKFSSKQKIPRFYYYQLNIMELKLISLDIIYDKTVQ